MHVCVCVRISVNSTNVQSLLDAANQYQIEPVKKMCVEFLKGQIDATNCLGKNTNTIKVKSYLICFLPQTLQSLLILNSLSY